MSLMCRAPCVMTTEDAVPNSPQHRLTKTSKEKEDGCSMCVGQQVGVDPKVKLLLAAVHRYFYLLDATDPPNDHQDDIMRL